MSFYASAYRTSKRHVRGRILRAAGVTALVPAAAAALLMWLVPETCNVWVNPAQYRWTCLVPGLMVVVSPVVAILLTVLMIFNRRVERPFPDGWLVIVLSVGMFAQVLLIGAYLVAALDQGYFGLWFTVQLFLVPQPFVAGSIAAAVYWIALHGQGRRIDPKNGKA